MTTQVPTFYKSSQAQQMSRRGVSSRSFSQVDRVILPGTGQTLSGSYLYTVQVELVLKQWKFFPLVSPIVTKYRISNDISLFLNK